MRPKNVSYVFQCIAHGLELYRAHWLFRQRLSLPELSPYPVQEGETGGVGVRVGWGGTQACFEVYKSWILPKFQQDYTHAQKISSGKYYILFLSLL